MSTSTALSTDTSTVLSTGFVHLRLHTEYSLTDGIVRVEPPRRKSREETDPQKKKQAELKALEGTVAGYAAKLKLPALAITDRNNLFAMVKFYKTAEAAGINACSHLDGLTVMQWRPLRGAYMRDPEDEIFFPKKNFQIIQLERIGKTVTMRVAHWGEPLQTLGSHVMNDMKDTVLAGLYICAHDSNAMAEARVWNVRIDEPVPYEYNPDKQGYLGCRMETMNVFDGKRKKVAGKTGKSTDPGAVPADRAADGPLEWRPS